eukprot:2483417-Prymnesium_polylepis.1
MQHTTHPGGAHGIRAMSCRVRAVGSRGALGVRFVCSVQASQARPQAVSHAGASCTVVSYRR